MGRSLDSRGLDSRERDVALLPKPLNPPMLNPRPAGLVFGCRGAGGRGFEERDSGRAGDSGIDCFSDSGDRTRPASFIAAFSSAFVGSLIGDFVLSGTGDEGSDCRPHKAVAAFTEEKPDF